MGHIWFNRDDNIMVMAYGHHFGYSNVVINPYVSQMNVGYGYADQRLYKQAELLTSFTYCGTFWTENCLHCNKEGQYKSQGYHYLIFGATRIVISKSEILIPV